MASNQPGFILRNCTAWLDRQSKLGQIGDITLPVPQTKVEEMRNAGMALPIEVSLGYEKMEASIKMPGFDPQVLKLWGLAPGVSVPLMVTGAAADEDGTMHSAVANMNGFLKQADPGNWKPGEMAENEHQFAIRWYKLEIDGNPIYEMDMFDVKVGGASQYAGIRNALLLE